jgi:2-oxo-4-hydroxy-4-carboxy-5-ureidoimidazoline decarboxylase
MDGLSLREFNGTGAGPARELLTTCLAVPRWVDEVLAGRPYPGLDTMLEAADMPLRPDEIRAAMRAHPRIGERPGSGWATSEQSGVDAAAAQRFRAANAEYEHRFGHVYLVCASGRDGADLLADLHARLGNDPATELTIAGGELIKIAKLRLAKALSRQPSEPGSPTS